MLCVSTDSLWVRLSEAEAVDVAFWVAVCALVVYWVFGRFFDRQPMLESLRYHQAPIIGAGLLAAISQLAFVTAVTETQVANVVAIVAAVPLIAAGCARLFLGERTNRRVGVAIAVTVAGIAVIVSSSVGRPTLRGDLLALIAVASFAANLTIWRRYPDMSRRAALSASAVAVIVVTSFTASPFSLDVRAYTAIAAMGLVFNPLGRLAHSIAPRYAPVSEVALFTPIETVAATVWAALFLSEVPGPATIAGATVVLAGVFYGTISFTRQTTP